MNSLFLNSWYPNKNNPTLGNFVQKHAEAAAKFNSVSCLSVFSDAESKEFSILNSTENHVHSTLVYYPKVTSKIPIYSHFLKLIRYWKAFKLGWNEIRTKNNFSPDLVHVNVVFPIAFCALFLKWKYKIPYVFTEHATGYHENSNQFSKTQLKIAKFLMNRAAHMLPVSLDLEKSLRKLGVKTPSTVVSNVVNETIFSIPLEFDAEKTQFIHISTANDGHKNVSGMIRTVQKLSEKHTNFNFKIISDGDLKPHIELAKKMEVFETFVQFESTKSTLEIAEEISKSNALVLFSNYENFPCVIAEAMMLGVPIISTHVNGIPEHVKSDNGILIPKQDEAALLHAMLQFVEKKTTFSHTEIQKYAFTHFSYAAVGRKLDEIYHEVIRNHAS